MHLVSVAISIMLLSGCNHMGGFGRGFGHAASGIARATGHVASGFARVAAPAAIRVARVAPVIARTTIVVAATAQRLSEASDATDESDAAPSEFGATAGAATSDVTNHDSGADPCSECPSDETCFYVDYMCPATTGPASVDP